MQKINAFTLRKLKPDDVFVFKVVACDNEVDRDYEMFSISTLKDLARLLIGKTIIADHSPQASKQCARIFDTEISMDDTVTAGGEQYTKLIAFCYIPRNEQNAELIENIETGIHREVSVGCAIKQTTCSICGSKQGCEHRKGYQYNEKTCYRVLSGASDAYEVSFVAVPAQRKAGVIKSFDDSSKKLDLILAEIAVIKSKLGIEGQTNPPPKSQEKEVKLPVPEEITVLIAGAKALAEKSGGII